jgi:hypothetical protein
MMCIEHDNVSVVQGQYSIEQYWENPAVHQGPFILVWEGEYWCTINILIVLNLGSQRKYSLKGTK